MPSIQPTRKWVVEGGEGTEEVAPGHDPAAEALQEIAVARGLR